MLATHVLILTHSEALGSILAATLCDDQIQTHQALTVRDAIGFLRLHPVKFLVCDFDVAGQNVLGFVPALRRAVPYRNFETMALTSNIDGNVQNICRSVDIDEVIVKPTSPRFLRERLIVRANGANKQVSPAYLGENVVSLFDPRHAAPPHDNAH